MLRQSKPHRGEWMSQEAFDSYKQLWSGTITHATALLENTEPQSKSVNERQEGRDVMNAAPTNILPGLRESWRILNVAPEEDLAFKVGRLMDRIKELEK